MTEVKESLLSCIFHFGRAKKPAILLSGNQKWLDLALGSRIFLPDKINLPVKARQEGKDRVNNDMELLYWFCVDSLQYTELAICPLKPHCTHWIARFNWKVGDI